MRKPVVALVLALVMATLVVSWCSSRAAAESSWLENVDYVWGLASLMPEDYNRSAPPYSRHVRIAFEFQNMTPDKQITGLRFRVRFKDSFGDVLFSQDVKAHVNMGPGESDTAWILYEDDWPLDDGPYTRLAPAASKKTLKVQVAMQSIVFSNGEALNFSSEDWQSQSIERLMESVRTQAKEQGLKPAKVKLKTASKGQSAPFRISTPYMRVAWLCFTQGSSAQIKVFTKANDRIKTIDAKAEDAVTMGDLTFKTPPGEYYLYVETSGDEWTVFAYEADSP